MVYRVTENPVPGIPGKTGKSHVTTFDDTADPGAAFLSREEILLSTQRSRQVNFPYYNVVGANNSTGSNARPTTIEPTIINTTVVNSSATLSSIYEDTAGLAGVTTRTKLTNNGAGLDTSFDIVPVIWDTGSNVINVYASKEIIELQIRFTVTTDTLGGAIEIDLETVAGSTLIHREEKSVNIQEQDFTINFKIVTKASWVAGGLCLFVKPELGMSIDLTDIEFTFIKTTQLA